MKKIAIVGFGRFGPVLYKLLKDDFPITIYTSKKKKQLSVFKLKENTKVTHKIEDIYHSDVIFYAVPIGEFAGVIRLHSKYFQDHHLLIDVLSVKSHPKQVFDRYLRSKKTEALLTHPMFGPDSSKNGFKNLPIVIDQYKTSDKNFEFWDNHFQKKGLKIVPMTARKHDELAANSQGLTHFIGRLLSEVNLQPTLIDTLGAKKLQEVMEQTCNDTWELFKDLQNYNQYTKTMRLRLGKAHDKLYNQLIPKQVESGTVTIGIQGGIGSFNEEAVREFIKSHQMSNVNIKYLYTSSKVLSALHKGEIDLAQFAIHNSIGGVVKESIAALAKYKVSIVEEFAIQISHTLMISPDETIEDIDTIMTHPQVLAQCRSTLSKKYPHLSHTPGKGKLIDHSLVAKYIANHKLASTIATMGSKVLADIYKLQIIEEGLQDSEDNYTSFLVVKRT